jgi:hypothetical protein
MKSRTASLALSRCALPRESHGRSRDMQPERELQDRVGPEQNIGRPTKGDNDTHAPSHARVIVPSRCSNERVDLSRTMSLYRAHRPRHHPRRTRKDHYY